jgi:hypothetical protein
LFSLFWCFVWALELHDVSINVWSGRECIESRVKYIADTWARQFHEINVFVDKKGRADTSKFPQNINFIEIGDLSKHLFIPTPWERAQPRFLASMHRSFQINDTKKWYVFCDDDSYIVQKTVFDILERFDHEEKIVVGHFYCAWPDVVFGKNHSMKCLSFPQGGAGVCISHGMMEKMYPHFMECNKKFNDRNYAGSMRFAKCVDDHVKDGSWDFKKGIQNYKSQFNSRSPIEEIEDNSCKKPPATFHKIKGKEMEFIHNSIFTEFKDKKGDNYFVSWNDVTCRSIPIFITSVHERIFLRFGVAITDEDDKKVIAKASSSIRPIFYNINNEIQISYEQVFGNDVTVRIHCTNETKEIKYINTTFEGKYTFNIEMNCPDPIKQRENELYIV